MEKLTANMSVSDVMYGAYISKKDIDGRIARELAHSLADEIVKHEIDKIMTKRKEFYSMGETIYQLEVHLLTRSEMAEYKELKRFKEQMKQFVE